MRSLLRAGAIALAASAIVLGGGVAAQAAAPAGEITVKVNRLVLEPGDLGHSGSVRIVIRNTTSEPYDGTVTVTEPITATLGNIDGGNGCTLGPNEDNLGVSSCLLDQPIAPGGRAVLVAHFTSPAKPQAYAQIAPHAGKVEVAGATAEYAAIFRSTTGSLRNPRPYVQDTVPALTVTATDATVTDGVGRSTVTVVNNGDAPHRNVGAELITPAGVDEWPAIEPAEMCGLMHDDNTPPGGQAIGCTVYGGTLAEGESRTFEWVFTVPAGTPAGLVGTARTEVVLGNPAAEQTDAANVALIDITVAG